MNCKLCNQRPAYKDGFCSLCLLPSQRQQDRNDFIRGREALGRFVRFCQNAGTAKAAIDKALEDLNRLKKQ